MLALTNLCQKPHLGAIAFAQVCIEIVYNDLPFSFLFFRKEYWKAWSGSWIGGGRSVKNNLILMDNWKKIGHGRRSYWVP